MDAKLIRRLILEHAQAASTFAKKADRGDVAAAHCVKAVEAHYHAAQALFIALRVVEEEE